MFAAGKYYEMNRDKTSMAVKWFLIILYGFQGYLFVLCCLILAMKITEITRCEAKQNNSCVSSFTTDPVKMPLVNNVLRQVKEIKAQRER